VQTIKKYANRKLYHTNRKQYITLDGIAELVQAGEEIEVVDNETGANITAQILSQVVLLSRERRSVLPQHLLTDLIQSGGDTIAGLRRTLASAFGGGATVDGEIRRRVQRLHDDGTFTTDEATRVLQQLLRVGDGHDGTLPGAAAPADIARLTAQVDALSAAVDQLLRESKPGR
jgi:polyhydroxyalkanoate synthesis repressor PhaR